MDCLRHFEKYCFQGFQESGRYLLLWHLLSGSGKLCNILCDRTTWQSLLFQRELHMRNHVWLVPSGFSKSYQSLLIYLIWPLVGKYLRFALSHFWDNSLILIYESHLSTVTVKKWIHKERSTWYAYPYEVPVGPFIISFLCYLSETREGASGCNFLKEKWWGTSSFMACWLFWMIELLSAIRSVSPLKIGWLWGRWVGHFLPNWSVVATKRAWDLSANVSC